MYVRLALLCLASGLLINESSCVKLNKEEDCKCRILSANPKIIGGRPAPSLAYPFMVSINLKDDRMPSFVRKVMSDQNKLTYHSCGGVLLNHNHVLTAAHCLPDYARHISVGGGSNDLIEIFDQGRIKVKRYFLHPNWNNLTIENDIAILELERPVQFSDALSPACLQTTQFDHYLNGGILTSAGFGQTSQLVIDPYTGKSQPMEASRYLKEVDLRDESDVTFRCLLEKSLICANSIKAGDSSCSGDSGSGLFTIINGRICIVGITSSTDQFRIKDGRYLAFCNGLTYFTKVVNYNKFIESVVGDDYCPYSA